MKLSEEKVMLPLTFLAGAVVCVVVSFSAIGAGWVFAAGLMFICNKGQTARMKTFAGGLGVGIMLSIISMMVLGSMGMLRT